MANLSKDEILKKIRNLEDKIYDCKAYIVSDFCTTCKEMYDQIHKYEAEIRVLQELWDEQENDL